MSYHPCPACGTRPLLSAAAVCDECFARDWRAAFGVAPLPGPVVPSPSPDPALAKAQRAHDPTGNHYDGWDVGCPCLECGWDAAFDSLHANTPEAQAALRELVRAAIELDAAQRAEPEKGDVNWERWVARIVKAQKARNVAIMVFAALATPTEEGQG